MSIRKTVIFVVIAAVCVIAGAVGYTVYQSRKPQPVSVDLSGQAPDSIDFMTDDVITDFSRNDAPAVVWVDHDDETDFITRDMPAMVVYEDFVVQYGTLVSYTGWSDHIVIPDNLGIIEIKDDAFAHSGIVSVVIPYGVTTIGYGAFDNCSSLTSVTIPGSVTSIEERAFSYSGLTSLTIPDSVTSIGGRAFDGCTSLTSVTIPDSVTSIEDYVFSGCTSLKQITVVPNGGDPAYIQERLSEFELIFR